MRTSRGLKWENKMYELKRSIRYFSWSTQTRISKLELIANYFTECTLRCHDRQLFMSCKYLRVENYSAIGCRNIPKFNST